MARSYVDTSAIAKRYITETGSSWVQQLVESSEVVISTLVSVELSATAARLVREGVFSLRDQRQMVQSFARDSRSFLVVALDERVITVASRLITAAPAHIPLRSLDALHLATAMTTTPPSTAGTFVSADRRLLAAASWLGFDVDNPENHP